MAMKKLKQAKAWQKMLLIFILAGSIFAGLYYGGIILQSTENLELQVESNPTTSWTFEFTNATGEALDGEDGADEAVGYILRYVIEDHYDSIEDFDYIEDFNDLNPSTSFEIEETVKHGETFTPRYSTGIEAFYWLKINCSGYTEQQIKLFDPNSEGIYENGTVEVELLKQPDTAAITGRSTSGTTSIVDTSASNWILTIDCFDADSEISDDLGYDTYLDFDSCTKMEDLEDYNVYNVITIDFNSTTGVNTSMIDVVSSNSYHEIEADGDKINIYIGRVTGTYEIQIKWDSGIFGFGKSLGLDAFAFKTGRIGGSLTTVDSYAL